MKAFSMILPLIYLISTEFKCTVVKSFINNHHIIRNFATRPSTRRFKAKPRINANDNSKEELDPEKDRPFTLPPGYIPTTLQYTHAYLTCICACLMNR